MTSGYRGAAGRAGVEAAGCSAESDEMTTRNSPSVMHCKRKTPHRDRTVCGRTRARGAHGLESPPIAEYRRVAEMADLLAENATTLDEPYAKSLGDGVRELRIRLHPLSMRITYWVAPQRRVVLLTVFAKTRDRETRQVERAKLARKVCADEHDVAVDVFTRE